MRFVKLVILTALVSTHALAGSEVTNGGGGVVCFTTKKMKDHVEGLLKKYNKSDSPAIFNNPKSTIVKSITSVRTEDLFGTPVLESKLGKDQIVKNVLSQLVQKTSFVSDFLDTEFLSDKSKTLPWADWEAVPGVPYVNDAGMKAQLPEKCVRVQLAARSLNYVIYDRVLTSKMSSVERAALILHELFYEVATTYGQKTSLATRNLMKFVMSPESWDASGHEFNSRAKKLFNEYIVRTKRNVALYASHRIAGQKEAVWVQTDGYFKLYLNGALQSGYVRDAVWDHGMLFRSGYISFYENGSVWSGKMHAKVLQFSIGRQKIQLKEKVSFYKTGEVFSGVLSGEQLLTVGRNKILFQNGTDIDFYQDGAIAMGVLAANVAIDGKTYSAGGKMMFYDSGSPAIYYPPGM